MSDTNRSVREEMIRLYQLKKLGFDFMGYTFSNKGQLSYHHLIVPKKYGGKSTIENGAILRQNTSHDYLHKIEPIDREIFELITNRMIEMNRNGKLDVENLRIIRDLLLYFEREHDHDTLNSGKLLIKREYVRERILLWQKKNIKSADTLIIT